MGSWRITHSTMRPQHGCCAKSNALPWVTHGSSCMTNYSEDQAPAAFMLLAHSLVPLPPAWRHNGSSCRTPVGLQATPNSGLRFLFAGGCLAQPRLPATLQSQRFQPDGEQFHLPVAV